MGCWNGTCMVSNLPILSGEEAVGFFIINSGGRKATDHCYSNEAWEPLLLPFRGVYNDYGLLEDIQEDWNTNLILEYFQKNAVAMEAGDNPYHERAVDPANITSFDDVFEAWRDDRLRVTLFRTTVEYLKNPPESREDYKLVQTPFSAPVAFVMIHGRVYDMMINHVFQGWDGKETTLSSLVEKSLAVIKTNADRDLTIKGDDEATQELRTMLKKHMITTIPLFQDHTAANSILNAYYGQKLAWDGEVDRPLLERMAELDQITGWMESLRKMWMPTSGSGGQGQPWSMYQKLNAVVDQICQDGLKKYGED